MLVRITDLDSDKVYQLCACGCVYVGETCPDCDDVREAMMGCDWPENPSWNGDSEKHTQAFLDWEHYRRHE